MQKSVCVFGSSSAQATSIYLEAAKQLGMFIAKHNWKLICGGANSGLILELAQSVQQNNGKVVVVVPKIMVGTTYIYREADETIVTDDLPSRKSEMESQSDAFIVLPGGIGTLDEIFTVLSTKQFRTHRKPMVLININGFLDNFMSCMRWLEREKFIAPGELSNLFIQEETVEAAVNRIKNQIEMKS